MPSVRRLFRALMRRMGYVPYVREMTVKIESLGFLPGFEGEQFTFVFESDDKEAARRARERFIAFLGEESRKGVKTHLVTSA